MIKDVRTKNAYYRPDKKIQTEIRTKSGSMNRTEYSEYGDRTTVQVKNRGKRSDGSSKAGQ